MAAHDEESGSGPPNDGGGGDEESSVSQGSTEIVLPSNLSRIFLQNSHISDW